MAFFTKVLAGGLVAGGISFFYQKDLEATTARLSSDLRELSHSLTALAASPSAPASFPPALPARLPLAEHIKARWNEKLAYGLQSVQQASVAEIAGATWAKARALLPAAGAATEETKA